MSRKNFTITELVEDPTFRRVAQGIATSDEIEIWNNWIEESPQNRVKVKAAISQITGFHFKDPSLPNLDKKWSDLYLKTAGLEIEKERAKLLPKKVKKGNKLKLRFLSAAIILIMSLVGVGIYNIEESDLEITELEQFLVERTITTSDDEKKTLRFSNGSKVVVESNSLFTYSIDVLQNRTINVTLRGEAWFEAESDEESDQPIFTVRTPDGVIKDIGTKFLVTVKNNRSRVVLQEGLVEVESINENNSESNNTRFIVGKGEMVEFNHSDILLKESVNSTFYTSWATGFIEFDKTELQDFADYLEQRFEVEVRVNPDLTGISLDGSVYFKTLEDLVRSVSKVANIPVFQSDDNDIVYIGIPNE